MTHANVTISILTYTALDACKKTIAAILPTLQGAKLMLTANGNPSAGDFFFGVQFDHPNTQVFVNRENHGFIGPNNVAFSFCDTEFFVMLNDDCIPPPDWLDKLKSPFADPLVAVTGAKGTCQTIDANFVGRKGDRLDYIEGSCMMVRREAIVGRLFSDYLRFAYCLTPETPVLNDNLSWVPIGGLKEGDGIVGVDEYGDTGCGRFYRHAHVTSTNRRMARCIKITMSDGRSVICTKDHRWLSKYSPPNNFKYRWREASELKVGWRICAPLRYWPDGRSFEDGWFSGILDGEGHVRVGNNTARTFGVGVTQNRGIVLDRMIKYLNDSGIMFTHRDHNARISRDKCVQVEVFSRRFAMELLGRLKPIRLMKNAHMAWCGRALRSRNQKNDISIISITDDGMREVVSIETTTRTFLANGMVSHNCEDVDLCLRLRERGLKIAQADFVCEHRRNTTSRRVPGIWQALGHNMEVCRKRWATYLKTRRFA